MSDIEVIHYPSSGKPRFMQMWDRFLAGTESQFAATRKNLFFFSHLFDAYYTGKAEGVCLTDKKQNSVLLWGNAGGDGPLEFKRGRVASGWGVYVEPDYRRKGYASALRNAARPMLREKGFDGVIGTALAGNKAGRNSALEVGMVVVGTDVWFSF